MPAITLPRNSLALAEHTARVIFHDSTVLELQHVTRHGSPARLLRALQTHRAGTNLATVVDLSKLGRDLDNELRLAADRDADGLLMFTLRQRFTTAAEARAAMARHTVAILPTA